MFDFLDERNKAKKNKTIENNNFNQFSSKEINTLLSDFSKNPSFLPEDKTNTTKENSKNESIKSADFEKKKIQAIFFFMLLFLFFFFLYHFIASVSKD
jgi:hypothetical protein